MDDKQQTLDKLNAFRKLDKFSTSAWNNRGLNPSSIEICNRLEQLFNECADNLIEAVNANTSPRQFKWILKDGLSNFRSFDYDTEEREFICDYFDQLSKIVQVKFGDNLNRWLYGRTLSSFFKIVSLLKPSEKIIETLSQDCTNCNAKLEIFITQKQAGITSTSWLIIQCNNCNEYNLLESPADAKQFKFGNYKWVESLSKEKFTEEQAKTRLEQIKFFRKK